MIRTIVLRFVDENVCATADLLWERAPETCRTIVEQLPLEGPTIHGMYSGPELFIRADQLPDLPGENQMHRPLPGDVGYWQVDGGKYASSPHRAVEVVFIYNRGAAIMGPDGQPTWVNLFAQIRAGEAEPFYAVARRVRFEGPKRLRIEAGE